MRTGIVIALNNKEKEISPIKIEQILEANKSVHICFVNNGSTDRTLEVLNSFKEKFTDRLSVVSIKNNKGIDSALKVGFKKEIYSLERLSWQVLFYILWLSLLAGFFVFSLDLPHSIGGGVGYFVNEKLYQLLGYLSIFVIGFGGFIFLVLFYQLNPKKAKLVAPVVNEEEVEEEEVDSEVEEVEIEEEDLRAAIDEITHLNPKPGNSMNETSRPIEQVIPDFT